MTAVLKPVPTCESPARAALASHRALLCEIEREAAPLRGQLHALQTNITAVQEQKAAAHVKVQERLRAFNDAVVANPAGEHRELSERWADAQAEFTRLDLRASALQNAAQIKADEVRATEGRAASEPPLLKLLHAAAVEMADEAKRACEPLRTQLRAAESEALCRAKVADNLAAELDTRHDINPARIYHGFWMQLGSDPSRSTPDGMLTRWMQDRIAEIRAEIEGS